jgi:hypothetical protein
MPETKIILSLEDQKFVQRLKAAIGDAKSFEKGIKDAKKAIDELDARPATGSIKDLSNRLSDARNNLLSLTRTSPGYEAALRRVQVLTNHVDKAQKQLSNSLNEQAAKQQHANKMNSQGSFVLLNVARIAQDSSYGWIGIANNVEMAVQSMVGFVATSGGMKAALASMGSLIWGPSGLILAFSLISTAFTVMAMNSRNAKKDIDKTKDALEELRGTLEKASYETLRRLEIEAMLGLSTAQNEADRIINERMREIQSRQQYSTVRREDLMPAELRDQINSLKEQLKLIQQYKGELGLMRQVQNKIGELREKQLKATDPAEIKSIEKQIEALDEKEKRYRGVYKETQSTLDKLITTDAEIQKQIGVIDGLLRNINISERERNELLYKRRELQLQLISGMTIEATPAAGPDLVQGKRTQFNRGQITEPGKPAANISIARDEMIKLNAEADILQGTFQLLGNTIIEAFAGAKIQIGDVLGMLAKMTAQIALTAGIKLGLGALFPALIPFFSEGGLSSAPTAFGFAHPDDFIGAKKFRSGGFTSMSSGGGIPAILHPDEVVFNKEQQKNLFAMVNAGRINRQMPAPQRVQVFGEMGFRGKDFIVKFNELQEKVNNLVSSASFSRV